MSTINVDNYSDRLGSKTVPASVIIKGTAKTLVAYDQVAVSIIDSENVSSVSDDSLGNFTVNYTNDQDDSNYVITATSSRNVGEGNIRAIGINSNNPPTTSKSGYTVMYQNTSEDDQDNNGVSIFGDLA